ncbi:MAG: hypothetical protein VYA17_02945 [Pseudomonadota bacterium]|nr:hypothetical protein [Pseudomonadota bacterium]
MAEKEVESTPAKIDKEIQTMLPGDASSAAEDAASAKGRRSRFTRTVKNPLTGYGFHKIATLLLIGLVFGIGGSALFAELGEQSKGRQVNHFAEEKTKSHSSTDHRQEAFKQVPSLILILGNKKFKPGETVPRSERYRLLVTAQRSGRLSLFSKENNRRTVPLIRNRLIYEPGTIIGFPRRADEALKFSGDVNFINFRVTILDNNQTKNWYYVFGFD